MFSQFSDSALQKYDFEFLDYTAGSIGIWYNHDAFSGRGDIVINYLWKAADQCAWCVWKQFKLLIAIFFF